MRKKVDIRPSFPSIYGIEFDSNKSNVCILFNSIKIKASKKNLSYSNQINLNFLRHEYIIIEDLFDNPSLQIDLLKKLLRNYENDVNIYPNDQKMTNYFETLKSVLSFFQGLTVEITSDNISNFSEIATSIKHVPLQQVTSIFNDVQTQYKKIKELIKIESLLSKINENNFEKTKFQTIQSFLTKESKYHNLLIDILLYYSKIRPMNNKFYINLIESLIQKNSNNVRMTSSSQLSEKKLTTTLNNKRIIKPQIKPPKNRQKSLSSTLQINLNKTENFETNQFSNIIIKELKNPLIRPFFTNYFIYRLFSNSIITTKKQKLTILNFVKESNSEELKE